MAGATSSTLPPCAIVIGVGASKGIGAAVCRRFAKEGLYVYVVGRSAAKLDTVVHEIHTLYNGHAHAYTLDATNDQQLAQLFEYVQQQHTVYVVVNNVGSNMPSRFLATSASFFDSMWRMTFLSGVLVSKYAIAAMQPYQQGTLLFTGASGSLRGKPFFAAFATGKSGLRAYIQAIAPEFKEQGIHIAHIIIDGMVDGDRINHFGFGIGRIVKWALKGNHGGLNVDAIADNYWHIHQQSSDCWTHEIDLRPYKEKF